MIKKCPYISVITVTYNCEKEIEQTLKSIQNQTYNNYELIIVDGKSTDATLEIINKYTRNINRLISEKDGGIYDAMNKGIETSSGEFLFFLNAGDILFDNYVFENIVKKNRSADIFYGNAYFYNDSLSYYKRYPHRLTYPFFCIDTLCHQTMFIRKEVFQKIGNYNINEEVSAIFEFTLKAFLDKEVIFKHVNFNIVKYNLFGISSRKGYLYNLKTKARIIKRSSNIILLGIFYIVWFFYKPIYTVISKKKIVWRKPNAFILDNH